VLDPKAVCGAQFLDVTSRVLKENERKKGCLTISPEPAALL
jgi:hypothetical protein